MIPLVDSLGELKMGITTREGVEHYFVQKAGFDGGLQK